MADVSDVASALESAIDAARVAFGATFAIYRGNPEAAALDKAMAAGQVHVTIMPRVGMVRNTTRYLEIEQPLPTPPSTLTAATAGSTVTFGGTGQVGAVGVQFGNAAYSTRTIATDAPADIAARLAELIPGATSAGPALTIPTNYAIIARIGVDPATLRILRNTEQQFAITIWCADPATRDTVAALVDLTLCGMTFLPLADGSVGRLRFANDTTSDKAQSASIYTRVLSYSVDYPITARASRPVALFPQLAMQTGHATVVQAPPIAASGTIISVSASPATPPAVQSAASYATTITGDGLKSVFTIQHDLNSTDVLVEVRDPTDGNAEVPDIDNAAPDPNTVQIILGGPLPAGAPLRVIIRR